MTSTERDEALLSRATHTPDTEADDGKPAMLPPNRGPVDKQALTRLLNELEGHNS